MALETLPLFCFAVFMLAIIPGPGVLLTVARTLSGGLKHATLTIFGILAGDLVFILLVCLGLKFIAESLTTVFIIIKYLGGIYLIWLGANLLFQKNEGIVIEKETKRTTYLGDFLAGLAVTLSNPKAIFFYLSFLPAFTNIQTLTTVDIIVISLLVVIILGGVMLGYAIATLNAQRHTQRLTKKQRYSRWAKKVAGGLMVSTGGILLSRP